MRMEEVLGFVFLVSVLVLTNNASALRAIGQIPINITIPIGETQQYTLIIYNDANETFTSTVNIIGNVSQVVTLLNTSITIEPFKLGTIYYNVSTNQEGFWSGEINVSGLSVPIYVYSKAFKVANWYRSGQALNIQPGDYRIVIQNVSATALLSIFQHGYLIQSKSFGINDEFSTQDLKIKVLDIFQDLVKIEITSKYLNTQINVEAAPPETGFVNFGFYTTQYANTVTTDTSLKETFILRNGLNEAVSLKTVEYSGTIITSEGRQPINAVQYNLGMLQPGEETSFVVEINTKGISPGVWTPILTVKGLTQSGKLVSSSITFVLTVTKSVVSPSPANITIDYPNEVYAGKTFNITISGLSSGMTVEMENNPHLIGQDVKMEEGKWIWSGYLDVNETQNATLYIKLLGGILKTFKISLNVPKPPEPILITAPDKIWVGDILNLVLNPSDAKVTINGTEYKQGFTFLLPGIYVIKAEKSGYQTSEKTIVVINPVKANVSGDKVGKDVVIQFSEKGNYVVKYNESVVTSTTFSDKLSFVPKEAGTYHVFDDLGHEITSFEVKPAGFFENLNLEFNDIVLIGLFIALVVVLIVFLRKKRKPKIGWEIEPTTPSLSAVEE